MYAHGKVEVLPQDMASMSLEDMLAIGSVTGAASGVRPSRSARRRWPAG